MPPGRKELVVVGDRVLVRAEEGAERTNVGLYLPPTAVDNQAVQGGTIVATGPGLPDAESRISRARSHGGRLRAKRAFFRCRLRWAISHCFFGRPPSRLRSRAIGTSWWRRPRFSRWSAASFVMSRVAARVGPLLI